MLSRGWIRAAGHYYSQEAKEMIFPADFDATKMFWLINRSGAHGARSGLLPLAKEILVGIFRGRGKVGDISASCEFDNTNNMSCYTLTDVLKRITGTLSKGTTFRFNRQQLSLPFIKVEDVFESNDYIVFYKASIY
jgi:hypothetical protein